MCDFRKFPDLEEMFHQKREKEGLQNFFSIQQKYPL